MHLPNPDLHVRGLWTEQVPLFKIYACYLSVVSIYTVFSPARTIVRMDSHKKETAPGDHESRRALIVSLQNKSNNLFHLTYLSVLLFGAVCFMQFPATFRNLEDSNLTGWAFISDSLATYSDFAACVFLVLLILHVAEWYVSARLRRLACPH